MATVITQELARDVRGPLLPIDDSGFDLHSHKMKHHSDGHQEGDVTERTFRHADRLDLHRSSIHPDPAQPCTTPAWRHALIERAKSRGQRG